MADDEAREEQAAELEALEAIFGDNDFQLLDADDNGCARFQVELSDDDDGGGDGLRIRLIFTHTPTYPRMSIHVVAHPLSGVSAPGRKQLQTHLEEVASNSIDMPAAFTLCEAARDWMAEHGGSGAGTVNSVGGGYKTAGNDNDDNKFETIESTQTEKVEVVSSKAIGTPVSAESFATWREAFVRLMDEKKSKAQRERERDAGSKLTGREFFESRTVVVSAESASFWESEANQLEAEG